MVFKKDELCKIANLLDVPITPIDVSSTIITKIQTRIRHANGCPVKSGVKKTVSKGMQDAIRVYEHVCKRAQNSKKANPSQTNNDCGSIRFRVNQYGMTKSEIEINTRRHLLAMKIGTDAYHINNTDINAEYKAKFNTLKINSKAMP